MKETMKKILEITKKILKAMLDEWKLSAFKKDPTFWEFRAIVEGELEYLDVEILDTTYCRGSNKWTCKIKTELGEEIFTMPVIDIK